MTAKRCAWVWKIVRSRHYDAHARYVTKGALSGEHVVEIETGHALATADFRELLQIADEHKIELSFGKTNRKAVVLS